MDIKIILDTSSNVNILKEARYCILEINKVQREFNFELVTVDWVDEITNEKGVIDYNIVYERKKKEFGEEPAVIITPNKLKNGMLAWDHPNFYLITFDNWKGMKYVPPLRTLFASYIAAMCCSFACNLSDDESARMTDIHPDEPSGCLSDYCPRGNRDVLISMSKSHICDECKEILKENGCQDSSLYATEQILNYVKSETSLYTKDSPYDTFMSHSSKDKPFVNNLVEELEKERIKVWIDEKEIVTSQVVVREIAKGIENSITFVYILSKTALKSKWVDDELDRALTKRLNGTIKIIPILVDDLKVPSIISHIKNVKSTDETYIQELITAIRIAKQELAEQKKKSKGKKKDK